MHTETSIVYLGIMTQSWDDVDYIRGHQYLDGVHHSQVSIPLNHLHPIPTSIMQLKTILASVLVTASYIVPFAEAGPIAAGIAMAATAIGGPFVGSLASIAAHDKRELPEGRSGFQVVPRDGEFDGVNKQDLQRCRDSAKDMNMQVTQQSKSSTYFVLYICALFSTLTIFFFRTPFDGRLSRMHDLGGLFHRRRGTLRLR